MQFSLILTNSFLVFLNYCQGFCAKKIDRKAIFRLSRIENHLAFLCEKLAFD